MDRARRHRSQWQLQVDNIGCGAKLYRLVGRTSCAEWDSAKQGLRADGLRPGQSVQMEELLLRSIPGKSSLRTEEAADLDDDDDGLLLNRRAARIQTSSSVEEYVRRPPVELGLGRGRVSCCLIYLMYYTTVCV